MELHEHEWVTPVRRNQNYLEVHIYSRFYKDIGSPLWISEWVVADPRRTFCHICKASYIGE